MSTKKTTTEFIKQAIETHNTLYDYSKTSYINAHTKIIIICTKHGEFKQQPRAHLTGQGCPKCNQNANWKPTNNLHTFIQQANTIHNNKYDYNKTIYLGCMKKSIIICPEHGEFKQLINSHLNGRGCPQCAGNQKKSTSQFIQQANLVHNNKYNYSKSIYQSAIAKIIIICPTHGEFQQRASEHLRGSGCQKCAGNYLKTTAEFIADAQKIHHNRYDYSKTTYIKSKDNVHINCDKHGQFAITAGYHLSGGGCPTCSLSTNQHDIYQYIINIVGKHNVRTNDRTIIAPYELDIYIPHYNFAIEFNGNFFHSYNRTETTAERNRHKNKVDLANISNIKLFQICSHEWKNNKDLIKSMINHRIGITPQQYYARKCLIRQIDTKTAAKFFSINHISGHRPAKINYGLFYNNILVTAINFNKTSNGGWEIIRYASLINTNTIGGLGKLISHFIKINRPSHIITFVDRRYGSGNSYINLGFNNIKTTNPGYIYLDSNCNPAGSRIKFQKHKLSTLQNFNPSLTEAENMFNHGYRRMWDAGHYKLELIPV